MVSEDRLINDVQSELPGPGALTSRVEMSHVI